MGPTRAGPPRRPRGWPTDAVTPALALGGSVVAASFALVRFAMAQNRAITERFTAYMERSLARQEELNERVRRALESLGEAVRDCSSRLDKIATKD